MGNKKLINMKGSEFGVANWRFWKMGTSREGFPENATKVTSAPVEHSLVSLFLHAWTAGDREGH